MSRASVLKALDGLAQHLYAEGFLFETNGNLQPPSVFTRHLPERSGQDMNASFDLLETSSQTVTCEVSYTDGKEVCVAFDQDRITSHEKPRFSMSAARRSQIDRLVKWTRAYL